MALVPIVRYMVIPHDFELRLNGRIYIFVPRKGISLCGIEEEDVPAALALTKICCGGRKRNLYQHASPGQIEVWNM